ncbi:2-methylaconitate cis-trans isomerase PrpF family protein [Peribacillus frigoritolerans]|uniref:2-methylaconitate cis-trans isomerase PrpF family protein n=1 Tax=Peribacillus frigoritolerans TaxID=450367 RepID=UPI003F7F81FE
MKEQIQVKCTIMRGGTSRAVFLNESQVPKDLELRKQLILNLFGSPDKRQIDGLGGADITTSKCVIIGPPSHPDADIDYTFIQVGIDEPVLSYEIVCGNISPAAGVYAIEEGFVRPAEPVTEVRVHNTNTGKILTVKVPIKDDQPVVEGDFVIDGVPGSGAEVGLDYSNTTGGATGQLLPSGNVLDSIYVKGLQKHIEVSIVDVGTLTVFFRATDIGLKGTEKPDEISGDKIQVFEEIRQVAADLCGVSKSNLMTPFQVMVAPSAEYTVFSTGRVVKKEEVDLVARMVTLNFVHKAFSGGASTCTSVAAQIEGTIVNEMCSMYENPRRLRIGHPSGVLPIYANVKGSANDWEVEEVLFSRTVRRIMDGYAYVRKSQLEPTNGSDGEANHERDLLGVS